MNNQFDLDFQKILELKRASNFYNFLNEELYKFIVKKDPKEKRKP
jgi:hypothetical protein